MLASESDDDDEDDDDEDGDKASARVREEWRGVGAKRRPPRGRTGVAPSSLCRFLAL